MLTEAEVVEASPCEGEESEFESRRSPQNKYAMKNQNEYIPEHLQERWDMASTELSKSSQELNEANTRYNQAILARIALRQELENWQNNQ